jgi:hypothetical protein
LASSQHVCGLRDIVLGLCANNSESMKVPISLVMGACGCLVTLGFHMGWPGFTFWLSFWSCFAILCLTAPRYYADIKFPELLCLVLVHFGGIVASGTFWVLFESPLPESETDRAYYLHAVKMYSFAHHATIVCAIVCVVAEVGLFFLQRGRKRQRIPSEP